jgi:DNA-binding CsgD family transcriptional regulator
MPNGVSSALLFEERLSELPADRLVSLGLTPREAEVLRWLVQGKSSFEIASILNISARTVSKHLERIYLRLGVENRHAAIAMVHDKFMRIASR